jgi:hypothetical protein
MITEGFKSGLLSVLSPVTVVSEKTWFILRMGMRTMLQHGRKNWKRDKEKMRN